LRRRFSSVHIEARVAQVREIEVQVAAERAAVQAHAQAQARALADRLWLPPSLRTHLAQQCSNALALLDGVAQRLAEARAGFAALPRDETDDPSARAPAPVTVPATA
jgi:MoxR-like ATPase